MSIMWVVKKDEEDWRVRMEEKRIEKLFFNKRIRQRCCKVRMNGVEEDGSRGCGCWSVMNVKIEEVFNEVMNEGKEKKKS